MRKYSLIFMLLLLLSSCIKDKINDYDDSRAFMKFYGGGFTDNGKKILQTSDNGYLILAETFTQDMDFQIMVIKVSANGNQQWILQIGDSSANYASDILINDDNSIFVLGTSNDNSGKSQIMTALINNQSIEWQHSYGRIDFNENPASVCKTSDNGYLIAGSSDYSNETTPNLPNKLDYLFFSIDNNGDSVRMRTRGLPENDLAKDIQPFGDDSYIVTGTSENYPASNTNSNIVLLEINHQNLAILNEIHLTQAVAENCNYQGVVSRIDNNNIFVFGNKINNSNISGVYYTHIVADDALNVSDTVVSKSFEKSENQVIHQAIASNNSREFAFVGFSEALDNNTDIYFSTFDLSGNVTLEKLFGGFGTEKAFDIIQTTDGGYAIIGTVGALDNSDICLIKIFNDGSLNKE